MRLPCPGCGRPLPGVKLVMFCTQACKDGEAQALRCLVEHGNPQAAAEAGALLETHAAVPVYTEPTQTEAAGWDKAAALSPAEIEAWGRAHNVINRARRGLSVCDTCRAPSNRPPGLECIQLESLLPPRRCAGRLVKTTEGASDD